MSDENPGRSRGRARGKARGQALDQARRPGQEAAPFGGPPVGAVPAGANGGGGRRMHRGVPRTDPVPPAAQAPPQGQVPQLAAAMSTIAIDSSGRGRSRPSRDDYGVDNTRPDHLKDKKGGSGMSIPLVANFFELLSRPQWCVYQYHVDFAPIVESSFMRKVFIKENSVNFGGAYIFDGMSDLKTVKKLPNEVTELFATRRTDDVKIRITLKRVAELAPNHPELGRLFNTQMRKNLQHLKFQLLGRYFFDQDAISEIPQFNLQIWQGVITSIRTHEEKLMMCVDTTHKVIRKETALQIIKQIAHQQTSNYRESVSRELVGQIVMTRYNNKTYLIEDIDWNLTPSKEFEMKDGSRITYINYYRKQYDIHIRDGGQPLMLCKSKEREIRRGASQNKNIYLVPELCCMTGLTDSMRANFGMMSELAKTTRLDPGQRVRNLQTFINRVNRNENVRKEMSDWGLKFSNDLVSFQGRILPEEKIIQGNHVYNYAQKTGDFSRDMRGKAMHVSKHLDDWVIICTRYDEPKAKDFLMNLHKVCPPMGMRVRDPKLIVIEQDRIGNYLQAFRDGCTPNTAMVVFIVNNNKKERYDALKKHTCVENAVASQVIVGRTLSKKHMLMSVATKIGIQMNTKLGGEPWCVEIPFKIKVMIIGYDTYHDSAKRQRSAGAFVASLNQSLTRWFSRVTFHSAGFSEELSNHVRLNFTAALKQYQHVNSCLPDCIIYYRDGVGDGQIRYVQELEVKPFKETIAQLMGGRSIRFAFIVVNKKINPRFFAPANNGYTNPPPGTVVDNTVTRYDRYDFFLVSQSVRQGTVAPTMYNVIEDCSNLKPEHMQRLSYKLTHLYFNWPGTIRVPAPCQYAHRLAFLTGQSLHTEPHPHLCDKLFYL